MRHAARRIEISPPTARLASSDDSGLTGVAVSMMLQMRGPTDKRTRDMTNDP
jgi:hypothetical protein